MSLLFGAVVCSIGNITRDFPFNWIVFASVSYNLRASHFPIVLKIRTSNFSLAATGIVTETRAPLHRQGRNSLPCSLISTCTSLLRIRVDFVNTSSQTLDLLLRQSWTKSLQGLNHLPFLQNSKKCFVIRSIDKFSCRISTLGISLVDEGQVCDQGRRGPNMGPGQLKYDGFLVL